MVYIYHIKISRDYFGVGNFPHHPIDPPLLIPIFILINTYLIQISIVYLKMGLSICYLTVN